MGLFLVFFMMGLCEAKGAAAYQGSRLRLACHWHVKLNCGDFDQERKLRNDHEDDQRYRFNGVRNGLFEGPHIALHIDNFVQNYMALVRALRSLM
mgnify:CR=1 FL=1